MRLAVYSGRDFPHDSLLGCRHFPLRLVRTTGMEGGDTRGLEEAEGVASMEESAFVDYYELMQISPNAEPEIINAIYRLLAERYHPDEQETADEERFALLNDAHRILSDPASRATYDFTQRSKREEPPDIPNRNAFADGMDSESKRRMELLRLLYARRRSNGDQPGLSLLEFESLMTFPREHLIFTVWYLQSKGMIQRGEESDYAITVEGVDHVELRVPGKTELAGVRQKPPEDG